MCSASSARSVSGEPAPVPSRRPAAETKTSPNPDSPASEAFRRVAAGLAGKISIQAVGEGGKQIPIRVIVGGLHNGRLYWDFATVRVMEN